LILKRKGQTSSAAAGRDAEPVHAGNVAGGVLFGIGWSITGMCPGPILVNVGEGKMYAIAGSRARS